MYQNFAVRTSPKTGAGRVALLRDAMRSAGFSGWIVPRGDAHMGENVAARDERLAWLTGFTGSAGCCVVGLEAAEILVDGRYTLQVRQETDPAVLKPVPIPEFQLADRLKTLFGDGDVVGFDPWLHGRDDVTRLAKALAEVGATLQSSANLIDQCWTDQPARPAAAVTVQPDSLAGQGHREKRAALAETLRAGKLSAAVLSLPDSIAWLLNIRGADIARTPVVQAFAIVKDDGTVSVFSDPMKFGSEVRQHLGNDIDIQQWDAFEPALDALGAHDADVLADRGATPEAVLSRLEAAGARLRYERDPCIRPKACKNPVEIAGARAAHVRDGAAMVRFLAWLDGQNPADLDEIAIVRRLEDIRNETGALRDIAFETICGSGPNGAIVHYRVNEETNRTLVPGDLLLIDSGAQYQDGTTDITRTLATGPVPEGGAAAFTRVLQGMIGISRLLFPPGLTGRDLDVVARSALWQAGQDYDHGTGHGVGAFLSVHEGPQGLSRRSTEQLAPGMILSNEPGYYREGDFGIRIENLIVIRPPAVPDGGDRQMLSFETLTLCPIDRRLILQEMLTDGERSWIDAYHARVDAEIGPLVEPNVADWLRAACAPL